MDGAFLKIWKFSPHPFNCRKSWTCSTFIQFFAIVITNFTLTCEIWARFLKNIYQKWKNYGKKKQDFERVLNFLIWKCRQNWIKYNSVRSLWLCGEKNRPTGMLCPHCIETKMKKTKIWKEHQINFRFFQTYIFE